MAISWLIVPYKRRIPAKRPTRYVAIDDQTPQIYGEGGAWSESEVLGNRAVVKVRASDETLATLATLYTRLPLTVLTDRLSTLSANARGAIVNHILDMGYTTDEMRTTLGPDISTSTLGQVLQFAASRRLRTSYDKETDTITCDGPPVTCRRIADVDKDIQEKS